LTFPAALVAGARGIVTQITVDREWR